MTANINRILGSDAAFLARSLPTCQRNVLPPSSWYVRSEMSVNLYQTTRLHIPQESMFTVTATRTSDIITVQLMGTHETSSGKGAPYNVGVGESEAADSVHMRCSSGFLTKVNIYFTYLCVIELTTGGIRCADHATPSIRTC
jgi:hypothetical protein